MPDAIPLSAPSHAFPRRFGRTRHRGSCPTGDLLWRQLIIYGERRVVATPTSQREPPCFPGHVARRTAHGARRTAHGAPLLAGEGLGVRFPARRQPKTAGAGAAPGSRATLSRQRKIWESRGGYGGVACAPWY